MKNFPHQFNQIDRIVDALRVFAQVAEQGRCLTNDTVVGRALAQARVYRFRDKSVSLTDNLAKEAEKPRQSRGTETCARDLRRLFDFLGFIGDGGTNLSQRGRELVEAADDKPARDSILRQALREMTLADDDGGNISHPYLILLRLVEARPGVPGELLGLCLEADDDSQDEFDRLLSIVDEDYVAWPELYQSLGVSDHMARNSIKVLPPLARQLGDIVVDNNGGHYLGDEVPSECNSDQVHQFSRAQSGRHPRPVTSDEIAKWKRNETDPDDPPVPSNPDDVATAIRARADRTERHNRLVRYFAQELELAGLDLMEYPFDCLGLGDGVSMLCEMKTLDGSPEDERIRVRACLAQLLYYEQFDLPVAINRATMRKAAVFEGPIAAAHQSFLEAHDCVVIWRTQTGGFSGTDNGLALMRSIGLI